MSDCLQSHELQHTRIFCPPLSPGAYPNSSLLSWCWYLTISFSAIPFSFCLQSFPASGSFPMSRLVTSGGQSVGALASASPSKEYSGFISLRIDWFDLLAVQQQSTKVTGKYYIRECLLYNQRISCRTSMSTPLYILFI